MNNVAIEGTRAWQTLSTIQPFATPWLKLRQDSVATHDGAIITYTFVDHPGFVTIVPVTADGEVLLLRQYRYAAQTWCWELPAGAIETGEDAATTARRELAEEVGGACGALQYIGAFYTTVGMSNQQCHVYLARDVEVGEMMLEPTELLDVVAVPWDAALDMARAGMIANGPSALALMLCQPYVASPSAMLAAA